MLSNAITSALVNLTLLVFIPFALYVLWHKRRHQRPFKEIAQRAGLQLGDARYLVYCIAFAAAVVAVLLILPPDLEMSVREGSAWKNFDGLGLTGEAIAMALIYGVVKTGFAEEFLFRGLIAGSLSRRLSLFWANLWQALIFLAPHVIVILIMPEIWYVLIVVFAGSLFAGWVRIKSESIVGPWLIHAAANVTVGLSVAIRSAA